MALTSQEMNQLVTIASQLVGSSKTFLAEAVQVTRRVGDPVEALRLLSRLKTVGRDKAALDRAGRAIYGILRAEPAIEADDFLLRVAWLKRLSTDAQMPPGPRVEALGEWAQASKLDALGRARRQQQDAPRRSKVEVPREPPPPARAERLPPEFEVVFDDLGKARETRRNRADRIKKGKSPKKANLELRPVDPQYGHLCKGLKCSSETEGMDGIFKALQESPEAPRITVTVEARDGEPPFVVKVRMAPRVTRP